jgi:hypothetical protein
MGLVAFALSAAGCALDMGGVENETRPPDGENNVTDDYRACVLAVLEACDQQDLGNDECTALIAETCNAGDPGDPNGDCYTAVFEECIAQGGDPMFCEEIARQSCMEEPPPPDDCWQTVYEECIAEGGCPEDCAVRADEECACSEPPEPPPCDDPSDPNCEPPPDDCWSRAYQECIEWGGSDEECFAYADQVCWGEPPPPCDDPSDPNCEPPPPDDCWWIAYEECIGWGGSDEECFAYADQVCWGDPGDPPPDCDPMDPNCYPPPDCDPDGNCGGTDPGQP